MSDKTSVLLPNADRQLSTPLPDEVIEEQQKDEEKDQAIKNLATDEGWLKIRKIFENHITDYEKVSSLVVDGEDDAKVANQARVNVQVARVLRGVLQEVDHHAEPE